MSSIEPHICPDCEGLAQPTPSGMHYCSHCGIQFLVEVPVKRIYSFPWEVLLIVCFAVLIVIERLD